MNARPTARDLMHDADNLIGADEPVRYAKPQFELETTRSLILVDGSGPVGLLTRQRVNGLGEAEWDLPAREFAVPVPILSQTQPVSSARQGIASVDFEADRIPVVNDEGRLVGIVDRETLMREAETAHVDRGPVHIRGNGGRAVELRVGMTVRGVDEEKLGNVDDVIVNRGTVGSFTISHGLLGRHHTQVTTEHIAAIDDHSVYLDFGKTEFDFLPDVEDTTKNDARPALT